MCVELVCYLVTHVKIHTGIKVYLLLCFSAGQFQRDGPAWFAIGNWGHGAAPGEM